MLAHDVPINWRLAHRGLVEPRANLSFDIHPFPLHHSPLGVFLPVHPRLPILPIRDWLHDDGNTISYTLFGRYRFDMQTCYDIVFTGLMIQFFETTDACLFRLSWSS